MKGTFIHCAFLAAIAVALSACHKKDDPVLELEKAAATMAAPETAPAAPAAPDAGPRPAPASPPPAKQVQQAITDFKAGNMEDAVVRLQLLRTTSVLSPQQRMALQDSVAAVMTEIYTLAEKGDARAKAAVARYEQMQTTR
jgi:hypothetical protein